MGYNILVIKNSAQINSFFFFSFTKARELIFAL